MRILNLVMLTIVVGALNCLSGAAAQEGHFGPPYDTFLIDSKHVDQTFEIHVSVPPFCTEDSKCPVVYFADADVYFGPFSAISGLLPAAGVPPTIIVGIGYPGDQQSSNWTVLRTRDLLLCTEEGTEKLKNRLPYIPDNILETMPKFCKGAPDFLAFIRGELIPKIESQYPAKPKDRTYYGFSGGGLFGWYTLFTKPETFNRYILGSGYSYEYQPYLKLAKEYAQSGKPIEATVFFSVGLDEPLQTDFSHKDLVAHYQAFARFLNAASIPGLKYTYHEFPDEVHLTAWAPTFMYGMRAVFGVLDCKPYLYADRQCPEQE